MASVHLHNLIKRYEKNGMNVVNSINLSIEDGEFMVLVGPSGCGKSTTLRMIAGLESVSDGDIYIGEKIVNDVPPKQRDISMVFQNYALYPNMSVYENMAFGMRLRKTEKHIMDSSVKQSSRVLEIEHLLERKPRQLSGGQRQRVALGRALVRQPQVFLLDEPLSNLDARLRVQMRTEIVELHRQLATTTIYVTHDQIEAMTMGTRICIMKSGTIQQVGTPEEVYTRPANLFVAGFIGTPPINILQGTVLDQGKSGFTFSTKRFTLKLPQRYEETLRELKLADRKVYLGVRPEFSSLPNYYVGGADGLKIKGDVFFSEMVGADRYIHVHIGENSFVFRAPAYERVAIGEQVEIVLHPEALLLFHAETEERLPDDRG
ncbi:sugar ABC transporter ATP-binding protein [Paenibacillus baekrokdamisoli]|uniref:Sugar ABC transporter ATP-binding protein n=1 Tax=Paenibacillus baekrokdamisoli TaxID=1712516 RepID=A0A3G9J7N3_9BACL|nr:sn-glycerol-3-phosphate ABC transporter ATP-binding protein UgpC [Paenibacillus baekrokdamisoli]MBB3072707.1 multiple sugar transport system ATP-binding protein [Paenibacillus baekrokdamisoli]BBH18989.1 sugar ABC transporter ATP-binding protein [Paenibacillus baekrokdamisoli]